MSVVLAVPAQLDLFRPIAPTADRDSADLRPYPVRFHDDNPQVMELLARLARRARARSLNGRVGFRMVWETARWMYLRSTHDASGFKLNNNLQAWYVRELMARFPELEGAFFTRDHDDAHKVRSRGNAVANGGSTSSSARARAVVSTRDRRTA